MAAVIGLAFVSTDASARPFGGGFRGGGFHGGFHGGFRGPGFRGFGPGIGLGVGLGLAAGYPYYGWGNPYGYDSCVAPQRVWTAYGWRTRLVNVCY
jgi:hypothetical protein